MTVAYRYKIDGQGKRHRLVMHLGHEGYFVRWVEICSGCECDMPGWDEKRKCAVGLGCRECGYTGKRRQEWFVPSDPKAWDEAVDKCVADALAKRLAKASTTIHQQPAKE